MALNLQVKSDDFVPFIKCNAKTGDWYSKDDAGNQFQVREMTAVVDLANIKVGWVRFEQNAAPHAVWDANGYEAPQPSPQHKRGFSVRVYSPKNLGGVRELMSNSSAVNAAIIELYSVYENAPESREGLVPVVRCEGFLPIKSRHGQNFRPVLRIVDWVQRPAALNGAASSPPVQPQPAPTPIAPWAAPVQPEPSSAVFDDDIPF
jgi:hypothetical protein